MYFALGAILLLGVVWIAVRTRRGKFPREYVFSENGRWRPRTPDDTLTQTGHHFRRRRSL